MAEEIQDWLEETYGEMFEVEKKEQDEHEYKFIIKIRNLKLKYTYLNTYTFNYNMLYLKSQVNKLITRFKLEGVEVK